MMRCVPLVLLGALLGMVPDASGCAAAPHPGEYVEIASESALIIWDEATKTEHFIRQATFHSTSPDFGFLVPTPSQPELAESDASVFAQLSTYTAPQVEFRTVKMPRPKPQKHAASDANMPTAAAPGEPPRGVEVLEHTEVGGMEAVVLKFRRGPKADATEDAKELAAWLKDHGYEFGPHLVNWLKPYIENDWVMTAFRVARRVPVSTAPGAPKPAIQEMQGKAIRMSFKTDRPFYPYREPEEPKAKPDAKKQPWSPHAAQRFLRVFFLGAKRVGGTLGAGDTPWNAGTAWSDKLNEEQLKKVSAVAKLPEGALKNAAWLTEFEDYSSPRPATDEVYYRPLDSGTVHRPPIVHETIEYYDAPDAAEAEPTPYWVKLVAILGGVAFLAALGGLLFVFLRHR